MTRIKWVLFLIVIARTEVSGGLWKFDPHSNSEKALETILESCYESDNSSNPIVIFGDFNGFIDKSSVIRINNFQKVNGVADEHQLFQFKASTIVLVEDSPGKLMSDLRLLRETKWWDHMARFFVISESDKVCENFQAFLVKTWKMEILNSIYICSKSMNETRLYTLNPFADYAPHPWTRVGKRNQLNVFWQVFNPGLSCQNLNYDKTKFLNGYEIKGVALRSPDLGLKTGNNYFEDVFAFPDVNHDILRLIIRSLNARGRFEVGMEKILVLVRLYERSSDILIDPLPIGTYPELSVLFPHEAVPLIVVRKSSRDVPGLYEILKLWSTSILIPTATALVLLLIVLTIKNHDFFLAMLDVIRLLTHTSIRTSLGRHSLRIYITTVLMLMVISNAVFEGKITAFLTHQEKVSPIKTLDELSKLQYKIYTHLLLKRIIDRHCPKCDVEGVLSVRECIEYASNSTSHACVLTEYQYGMVHDLVLLEHFEEPFTVELMNFKIRMNWPLQHRVNDMVVRLVESGIFDFLKIKKSSQLKRKRLVRESDESQLRYKPLNLSDLRFAFLLLACGLSLATFVFYFELQWGLS